MSKLSSTGRTKRGRVAVLVGAMGAALLGLLVAERATSQEGRTPPDVTELARQAQEASKNLRSELRQPGKVSRTSLPVFRAGAAQVEITPTKPMYLDGYFSDRLSTGVHDPIYAKAIVLDDGRTRVALVVADLIGYYHQWVREARAKQDVVPARNVVICTTHNHATPCTLGVFGPRGAVELDYIRWVGERMAEAIRKAASGLRPARVGFAAVELPVDEKGEIPGVARNWHNPGVVDPALLVMRLEEADGNKPIATAINFGNHPDVLGDKTTQISADFFQYIYAQVTAELGGMTLVFNRGLGGVEPIGMGTNDMDEAEMHMERIGRIVSQHALRAAAKIEWVDDPRVRIRRTECLFPLLSPEMAKAVAAGAIPVKVEGGAQQNEMSLVDIGPAQMLTVPGEPHPEVIFKLTDMMDARYRFVLAMADDEIGYVVPGELYNPEGIQEMLSAGQDNEFVVLSAAAQLLGVNAYVEPECLEGMESKLP